MNLEIENYEWEEIHKILGKINNRIEAFRECIIENQNL